MALSKKDKTIVLQLKENLISKFGGLIASFYCYGSRITGNKKESDFDVMIVTKEPVDWQTEFDISSIVINHGINNDIVFDVQFIDKEGFSKVKIYHPFYKNVEAEGILV